MAIWTKIAVDNFVNFYRSYVHSSLDITYFYKKLSTCVMSTVLWT